jgi:rhomboid family GlyGly-CTERM serine protease
MGLLNGRHSGVSDGLKRHTHWSVAAFLIVVSVLVAAFGDAGRELMQYDRPLIQDGEFWRLVTGHFAHLGNQHLLLNIAGLVLSWLLVGRNYSTAQWLLVLTVSIVAISAGFWFLDRNMMWYVGMSGCLHGLLFAGAVAGIRQRPGESAALCILIIGKLTYEQLLGPLPGSESTSGGEVAVNAHLFGTIGGAVAAAVIWHRVGKATSL